MTTKRNSEEQPIDAYDLPILKQLSTPWTELSTSGKVKFILITILKIFGILFFLYTFVLTLGLLGTAFKILGGKTAGETFRENEILQNPIAALMAGVIATILVQSSSTSTSVIVSMVAAGILTVRVAIPIIMGANIGTAITNTLVAQTAIHDKESFRRAFASATVHDVFNWLCVLIFLPLEYITHVFERISEKIVAALDIEPNKEFKIELLDRYTKPVLAKIVQIDKSVITDYAEGKNSTGSILKIVCSEKQVDNEIIKTRCDALFSLLDWSDAVAGTILLITSLVLLTISLLLIVRLLQLLFTGYIAHSIRKAINLDIKGRFSFIVGYILIVIGCILTILVQSSSILTSTLTQLATVGILHITRIYPLTLGSNIGTTFTSLLAALASKSTKFEFALQISICHILFNVCGIVVWYPIPYMRSIPIYAAKKLGTLTANHRWFGPVYIAMLYILLPVSVFFLSFLGIVIKLLILTPIFIMVVIVIIINFLQVKRPSILPQKLRDWEFLPKWMHSLTPPEKYFAKIFATESKSKNKGKVEKQQVTTF